MAFPLSTVALQRWLLFVAFLRSFSVFLGIFSPDKFKVALIDRQPQLVNPLFGRLFAAWTTVTCGLCVACAREPSNAAVYGITLGSFAVAIVFFLSELFIYRTMTLKGALSPMIVACVSAAWMVAGWSTYVAAA